MEKQEIVQQTSEGVVSAPNSGRILKVPVAVGGVVMPGEVIAVLTQENYILRVELPESHARFLKIGDVVEVDRAGARRIRPRLCDRGASGWFIPTFKTGA